MSSEGDETQECVEKYEEETIETIDNCYDDLVPHKFDHVDTFTNGMKAWVFKNPKNNSEFRVDQAGITREYHINSDILYGKPYEGPIKVDKIKVCDGFADNAETEVPSVNVDV